MEAGKSEASAQKALSENKPQNESPRDPLKKAAATNEYAGDRIKDLADKVGFIGALGALILGIILWSRSSDIAGLFTGFVVSSVGIAISIILTLVVRSYGDMLNMTVEQMKLIKKLEARRAGELAFWGSPKTQKLTEEQEPCQVLDQEQEQEMSQAPQECTPEDAPAPDAANPEADAGEAPSKPGVVIDRVNKTVRYTTRSAMDDFCPICGRKLYRDYKACVYCGCKLIFSDEEKLAGERKAVELLRTVMNR